MTDNRSELTPLVRIAADKAHKELGDKIPEILSNDVKGTIILNKYEESEVNRNNSFIDPLTELLNRRGMVEEYKLEESTRKRLDASESNAFIALDLIGLKRLNTELTFNGADNVIKEAAVSLRKQIRKTDLAGRWGGDEFLLILFGVDEDTATNTIEKILNNLPEHVHYNIGYQVIKPNGDVLSQINRIMGQMEVIKHMGPTDETGRTVGNGVVVNIDNLKK